MSCIFCRVIAKEIPSDVVREEKEWVAIRDIHPQAPHHLLLISRRHVASLDGLGAEGTSLLGGLLLGAAELARGLGAARGGYRVVINTGPDGGQTVDHLHVHLLAGRPMAWPPG